MDWSIVAALGVFFVGQCFLLLLTLRSHNSHRSQDRELLFRMWDTYLTSVRQIVRSTNGGDGDDSDDG